MMAVVQTGRREVVTVGYLHPEYEEVLRCYGDGRGFVVRRGLEAVGDETAALMFQQPNFLGLLEDAPGLTELAHHHGALSIACVDPVSLAIVAPPGEYGADIAVGEGQQLGLPVSFGGPHVGFIACRRELTRRLPGRLVGEAHVYAFGDKTPGRKRLKPQDWICFYANGIGVIGHAKGSILLDGQPLSLPESERIEHARNIEELIRTLERDRARPHRWWWPF